MPNGKGYFIIADPESEHRTFIWDEIFADTFNRADGAPANNWTVAQTYLASNGGGSAVFAISSNKLYTNVYAYTNKSAQAENWIYRDNEFGTFAPPYDVSFDFTITNNTKFFVGIGHTAPATYTYKTGVMCTAIGTSSMGIISYNLSCQFYNNGTIVSTQSIRVSANLTEAYESISFQFYTDKISIIVGGNTITYDGTITYPDDRLAIAFPNDADNGQLLYLTIDNLTIEQRV